MRTEREIESDNRPSAKRKSAQEGGAKMLFKRIRFVAQVIGFVCVGLLAFYGTAVAVSGRPAPWSSPNAATTAITPGYVSYQGTLRDASDDPANGAYNMKVRICDDAACTGDILWCEKHNGVEVREGRFNLLLGDGDGGCVGGHPTGPISADIFTQPDRWVELRVGGTLMTPRQRLAAAPYAMAATYANKLSAPDGDPAEAVTVNNAGDVHIGDGSSSADVEIPMGGVCIDSDGACASPGDGGLRVGDSGIHGTDSSGNDLYLVPSTGKVGVGTTDPQKKLDVDGDVRVSGDLGIGTTNPDKPLTIQGTGSNSEWISFKDTTGATQWHLNYNDTGLNFVETGVAGGRLFLDDGGKVGIGTRSPEAKLDVEGVIEANRLRIDSDGDKPIKFRRLSCTGHTYWCNYQSQEHADTWTCGIVGLWVNTDFDENAGDTDILKAIAEPSDWDGDGREEWVFQFDISRENSGQDWQFVAICVRNDIADATGF